MWTDGGAFATVTFQAYDQNNALLGTLTYTGADGDNFGETAEDRFFSVTNAAGISKIFLSNAGGGIEMDHLQYGGGSAVSSVSEPASLISVCAGLIGLFLLRRRVPGAV